MPTITEVRLDVTDTTEADERLVTVEYDFIISNQDVFAGTVFLERVSLWGDDRNEGGGVERLSNVRRRLIKCGDLKPGPQTRTATRKISKQTLDEDADTIGATWTLVPDELFARVSLQPFVANSVEMDSDPVPGQFGEEGKGQF